MITMRHWILRGLLGIGLVTGMGATALAAVTSTSVTSPQQVRQARSRYAAAVATAAGVTQPTATRTGYQQCAYDYMAQVTR